MTEVDAAKIQALRDRLHAEQRRILLSAADTDCLPSSGAAARISDLDRCIVATDELLEEIETRS